MVRKTGVPPDARVDVFGQVEGLLIVAGFGGCGFDVNQVGPGDHGVRGFIFTGMVIDAGGFLWRTAGAAALAVEDVDDIVVRPIELRLGEKGKQVLVSAMPV